MPRLTVFPPCPICRKQLVISGERPAWEAQLHAHIMSHLVIVPADS